MKLKLEMDFFGSILSQTQYAERATKGSHFHYLLYENNAYTKFGGV